MRKLFLFASTWLVLSSVHAQKYSFKKGKINADDVTIAKYNSKGGMFKLYKIDINSLENQPLMHIQEKAYDFKSPFVENTRYWLSISFPNSTQAPINIALPNRTLEKVIMEQLFKDGMPSLIKDGQLDAVAIAQFQAANHYNFEADSLAFQKMEEENKARIATVMPRDLSKPIELRPAGNKGNHITLLDVYQADLLIGRVEKKTSTLSTFNGAPRYSYSVWMKTVPYTFLGTEYNFSPVAFLREADPSFDNDVIMMKDKRVVKFKTPGATVANAEYSFVKMLIDTGNL